MQDEVCADEAAEGPERLAGAVTASVVFEGWEKIADARHLARSFLADVRVLQNGLPVSPRVLDLVELVVSELATNARKYAPGPARLTLDVRDECVEVSVWDSNPTLPTIMPPDPFRVAQHGLEIVAAAATSLRIRPESVGKRITASVMLDTD
ncbi:ATP-binding protein [Streptomyces sp. NPDC055254]